MGISLRHHVLSLVAVFLMLFVGLLVGVGLSSDPELTRHIQTLNEQFDQLMEENATVRRAAAAQEDFARQALPRLIAHKLDDQRVVVLVTCQPPDESTANEVVNTLTAAGADVPYRVVLRKALVDRATEAFGSAGGPAQACERAAQSIATYIAKADEDGLHGLKRRGLVRIRGRTGGLQPSMVVVVGGAKATEEALGELVDAPLVEALISAGIEPIVACEDSAEVSYMETYRELGISTVDNVGLVRGQFSLVMALAGQPGNYGDGRWAQKGFATLE
jgi:outer membrane murein-binding lipoprotein Lpp